MKLLHTADIHFGSNAYGRIDPDTGLNTRLMDFKRSFEFMVERALEEEIDLFLFAGDGYRTADPTPTQQRTFAECLKPISDNGIPIVMIVGNHDHPVSYGKASALDIFPFLDGDIHVFRQARSAVIETKSGPLQLIALPWPIRSMLLTKEQYRSLEPGQIREFIEEKYIHFVNKAVEELDPDLPTVMAAHLSVHGAELSGSEHTSLIEHEPKFMVSQLARPEIDYIALGHIHRYQDRNKGEHPPVVYSGSIECVSFKEWDTDKGFVFVDIESKQGKKETSYRFVKTPYRPFLALHLDIRDEEDPTARIIEEIEKHPIEDAIVRIRYRIDESKIADIDLSHIRDALKPVHVVASIERITEPLERRRKTVVTRESSLEDALRMYIAQHESLASLEEKMVEKALELEMEFELHRNQPQPVKP